MAHPLPPASLSFPSAPALLALTGPVAPPAFCLVLALTLAPVPGLWPAYKPRKVDTPAKGPRRRARRRTRCRHL